VAEVQGKAIKRSRRNPVSRLLHAKNDKELIAAWKLDLNRILHVFNVRYVVIVLLLLTVHVQTELAISTHGIVTDVHHSVVNTNTMVSEMHHNMLKGREGGDDQHQSVSCIGTLFHRQINNHRCSPDSSQVSYLNYRWIKFLTFTCSILGESPPPPPRAFFGRDELIETIVSLAQNFTPIALIGAGGVGKTSIALTVLHDSRIKQRFGDGRRFIRCDKFPASCSHFLSKLSNVIGAGVENPEDLTPLRPLLSSKEMLIILDNAESILDPQATDAQKIYTVVEELSQFETVCLCITSRITTVPRHCKRPEIPTLSMEAACNIFYSIYDSGGQSEIISNLLTQLDFHALSITLLATTASHNLWDYSRLAREWEIHHTKVLQTEYNESLAATIELSLASPTFQELGPNARALLEVVAFFPQGIDEDNLDWLFPTIPNRANIFNKFCILSLTYRSNGLVVMLAPLQDYLCPKNPMSAPLLCTAKDHYLNRLLHEVDPALPGFKEAQWITSEDVNVEHLFNVFTTLDADSANIWDACANFMSHLYWYKQRLVILGPRIEGLPDDHPFKPKCLFMLSRLFKSVGNGVERKQLLVYTLELWRERGNNFEVVRTLRELSQSNRMLKHYAEGIQQAKEALEIHKQLNNKGEQAQCLKTLAYLLYDNKQLDAAEEAALQSINLISDKGNQFLVCESFRLLGDICSSRGQGEKSIKHYKAALEIASFFNWHYQLLWIHYDLAKLFHNQGSFDDAHKHIAHAKSHTTNDVYRLGRVVELQARFWYRQKSLEKAKAEILYAISVYEKIGAIWKIKGCEELLQLIEKRAMNCGKHPEFVLPCIPIYHPFLSQGPKSHGDNHIGQLKNTLP
jgi:tetratricopeptide (TPR) repeat protein